MEPLKRKKSHRKFDSDEEGKASPGLVHDDSNWLVSYADLMTLLFGFFVLMYSFSRVDRDQFEIVRKSFVKYFGGSLKENPGAIKLKKKLEEMVKIPGGIVPVERATVDPALAKQGLANKDYDIQINDDEIVMKFQSNFLFESGGATLKPEFEGILEKLKVELLKLPLEKIEVEGHTDSDAIQSTLFPSNWELSSARASAVVRKLESKELPGEKFQVTGYSSVRPIGPNEDKDGKSIDENKKLNRRVLIKIKLGQGANAVLSEMATSNTFELLESNKNPNNLNDKLSVDKVEASLNKKEQINQSLKSSEYEQMKKNLQEQESKLKTAQEKLKTVKDLEKQVLEIEKMKKKSDEINRKIQSIDQKTIETMTKAIKVKDEAIPKENATKASEK